MYHHHLGTLGRKMLVGGDISSDGQRIVLRRAQNEGAWMWARDPSKSVEEALLSTGSCDLVLELELQGEAIAFDSLDTGFYTTSEGLNQPIYLYTII